MGRSGVFFALGEYLADVAGQGLFERQGLPIPIRTGDLHPRALQRRVPGQAGLQRFFTVGARPFCLYLVVSSPPDPAPLVAAANRALANLTIDA